MTVEATHSAVVLLPFSDDPLQRLAHHLLAQHASQLPDLTAATVLLPDTQVAPALRRHLLDMAAQRGYTALLGPNILTLGEWLEQFPLHEPVAGQHGRELMLIEALREHQALFGAGTLWTLADALLELFDELTLNQVGLPDSLPHFQRRIAQAYGRTLEEAGSSHSAMEMESRLVHTLWHAWHAQLRAGGQIDAATAMLLRLRASLQTAGQAALYLLDPCGRSRAEREWLCAMVKQPQVVLFLQGELAVPSSEEGYLPDGWLRLLLDDLCQMKSDSTPRPPVSELLHQVYDPQPLPMRERAARFQHEYATSPLLGHLEIFATDNAEAEARAVETQVRMWLLEGRHNIGIVTENRRLARRVRALLERANIHVNDAAGWALSTTSAAAVVERWLECVEEDFPWRPLLDLLKSPFFSHGEERPLHLETVYRFEREIVHTDNIGIGLARYRACIVDRQRRLDTQGGGDYQAMLALLERLKRAAYWLAPCLAGVNLEAARIIDLLQASLREVGLALSLANDAAGQRLLDELELMRSAAAGEGYPMAWMEFRTWLGRTLERYNFCPPVAGHTVRLMNLAQSAMQRFDGLILAGAEQQHLPGGESASPFFNDHVRRELGLATHEVQLARRFHLFRRLPESAQRMLITHRREENGEEVPLSPWVELLSAFHRLAWDELPSADRLRTLIASSASEVTLRNAPLPGIEGAPAPVLPPHRMPPALSASSHQQLIDCPYLFFAAQGLRLAPPDTIREALEKADYGAKVHRCLQAFHDGVEDRPGPFSQPLSPANRDGAIALMMEIAQAEFHDAAGARFENRAWLKRWQALIPAYIDWQLERAHNWRPLRHEEQCNRGDIVDGAILHGRLDRLDDGEEGIAVVDYKTGLVAKEAEVLAGESVQLPFYALLAGTENHPVVQVELLRLDEGKVASPVVLHGEALEELKEATRQRLATLLQQIKGGSALPAWGDERTCGRCNMEGLCRRQTWPL
ncbi:MAG TPA: PD-(D/E)XK nuclease family protein [Gammaproteobacteria bacterium]